MKAMRSSKQTRSKPAAQQVVKKEAAEAIVAAATTLFARNGYDGTSTKDICEAAGVNIAGIHYHFGSKEALYIEIIERFGGARLESVQRLLIHPQTYEEFKVRVDLFLRESLHACLERPELTRIVQTEIELLRPRSEEVFKKTFVRLFETLVEFLKSAQHKGFVDQTLDPRIAAQFLFNQLRQVTRGDAANAKFFGMPIREDAFRERWFEQTLKIFMRGVFPGKADGKRETRRKPARKSQPR